MSRLKAEAARVIAVITPPGRTYFTDESVNPVTHTAGSNFTVRDAINSMRVTDKASLLQTEARTSLRERHGVIHTDSRVANDILRSSMPDDINLLNTVLTTAQGILVQGRTIIINWVPNHIDIKA